MFKLLVVILFALGAIEASIIPRAEKTVHQIIRDAQTAPLTQFDDCGNAPKDVVEAVAKVAKEVLSSGDFSKCSEDQEQKMTWNWCYQNVAEQLADALKNKKTLNTDHMVVTVGTLNRAFTFFRDTRVDSDLCLALDQLYVEIGSFNQ